MGGSGIEGAEAGWSGSPARSAGELLSTAWAAVRATMARLTVSHLKKIMEIS
jgi:hypothetical protein